jgi:hypothetical protein
VDQGRFPRQEQQSALSARRENMPVTLITYANPVQGTSILRDLSTVVLHALQALTQSQEQRNAKRVFLDNIMMLISNA